MPRETVKSSLRLSVSDEPLFAEKAAGKVLRRGKFSASLAFIRSLAGGRRVERGNNHFGPILPVTA